jgi:phosphomannomutase
MDPISQAISKHPLSNYSLVVFDLDGTLTPSKSPMEPDIAEVFIKLLEKTKIAVISGGNYPQFQIQFLGSLPTGATSLTNLLLLPTSGTRLYTWRGSWNEQYAEHLAPREKEKIMMAFNQSLQEAGYIQPVKTYGPLFEDRGSQVTFSAIGQQAPVDLKKAWDPDHTKRENIIKFLQPKIPEFDIHIGGGTSIDVTHRGVNKAYGIRKLEEFLKIGHEKMIFVGDLLFPGGNDYPVKATGVDCIQVSGPEEAKRLLQGWLAEK